MKQTIDSLSTKARNNQIMRKAHRILVIVMNVFCLLQVTSGLKPGSYVLVTMLLGFFPVLIDFFEWRKNPESDKTKYIAAIGFGIFYTYCLFTSINQLVFIFAVPMILIAAIYNDEKYSFCINMTVIVESLIVVIGGSMTGKFGYISLDYGIIQIVSVVLIGLYSNITTRTMKQNFKYILNDMSSLSEEMKSGILDIHTELEQLSDASKMTMNAMEEVSTGTNDTAEAVQNQLMQTQTIQERTDMVDDSMQNISTSMEKTMEALEHGTQNVANLVETVEISVKNGQMVTGKLELLEKSVKQINTITDVINTVARQIGLLSLNARIEASHAGEAGKGFAVVASEISELAGQTSAATVDIVELIEDTSENIHEVIEVIYQLLDGIDKEKESTERTNESFDLILENTRSIQKQLEYLKVHMGNLKDANKYITDSVETISAVSEEVLAHAAETRSAEGKNVSAIERMEGRMKELTDLIGEKNQ